VTEYWLTLLVFFPLAAGIVIALLPATATRAIQAFAIVAALAETAFSLPLWWRLQPSDPGWQFEEKRAWLPGLGASYHLGADGISALLVLLTTVVTAIAVLGATRAVEKRAREF
jgi:NADH-quinone oxidoreductase subunit M